MDRLDRRSFLRLAAAGIALPASAQRLLAQTTPSAPQRAPRFPMAKFPEKAELIVVTDRPPQLETPIRYFAQDLTPNEAFFVRWHLAGIPTSIDTKTFRLSVGGHVEQPLNLSLDDLRKNFQPVSYIAVGQCSGNSRSFFQPRVLGGQWGNGAVGNAKWTGVRLRDLLNRANVKQGAVDVSFAGLDRAPLPDTPQFVKSLDINHAMHEDTIVAYAMNDADLPMLNGFPLRLIVPGWFATYWVKMLNQITVLPQKFSGFWMDKAYRIPNNREGIESPTDLAKETIPINRHTVRSLFVTPTPGQKILANRGFEITGVALDDGAGITKVEICSDGQTWVSANLDKELGKYSWRRFRLPWIPVATGNYTLMCRATNANGETQVTQQWNRSGYQRNVIEKVDVTVA
jgi:DMSO/TMAO reductase YedYZ molybdopterin-dependent catalytic subunit